MDGPLWANFGYDIEKYHLQNFNYVNYLLLESYKCIKINAQLNLHVKSKFKLIFHNVYLIEKGLQKLFFSKKNLSLVTTIPIIYILTMIGIENNFRNVSCKTNTTNNTLLLSGSATTPAISNEVTASMGDLHNPSYFHFLISLTKSLKLRRLQACKKMKLNIAPISINSYN